jgi:hypothetical protein
MIVLNVGWDAADAAASSREIDGKSSPADTWTNAAKPF